MARFNFKDNPVLNDETFIGPNKYRWNGVAWILEPFNLNDLLSQLKQESINIAVDSVTQSLVHTAPEALNTIAELATALGNDENFATTMTNALATKADEASVTASLNTKANKTKTLDEFTGTTHTLALTHAAKIINCSTNNMIITVPTNLLVSFPIGTEIAFVRQGTQTVQIVGSVGVTVQSVDNKNKIKGQYGTAAILKTGTDTWVLAGSLEA